MKTLNLTVKKLCGTCGKPIEEISSKVVEGVRVIKTVCGHVNFESNLVTDETAIESFVSEDGRKLRPFQVKRIKDAENSNGRCLLNQEMGLGKTVIFAGLAKIHFSEMAPILIVCKAGLKLQMFWEMHRWIGKRVNGEWEGVVPQVIDTSRDRPVLEYFKIVIISFETLAQAKWVDDEKYAGAFKTIFIDECQKIKNPSAKMTKAVRKLCSGTIIKKRAPSKTHERKRIQMIAQDLMRYHGISDRFELLFEDFEKNSGITECVCKGEGIITGRIVLDNEHVRNDTEENIIDTILHEIAHAITPGAGHSSIWRDTARSIGADPDAVGFCDGTYDIKETMEVPQYIIAASGTPIKNNAAEYYTMLNILKPERFGNKEYFERKYVDKIWNGTTYKMGGIKPFMIETFQENTKDFIFRDVRTEVAPELPLVDRQFRYSELGEEVSKAYGEALQEFDDEYGDVEYESMSFSERGNLLAYINKMRQIVGMSKVAPCVDYVSEFLEETPNEKLVVFVHHIAAGNVLRMRLESLMAENGFGKPLTLTSDMDSEKRNEVIEQFRDDPMSRILVASTLAAGEGLNLQFCSHCVLMERQWNPANEEQAETRFTRIGSEASSVIAMYLVATGTIDEWLAELVEQKRSYMASALDGKETNWDESNIIQELFKKLRETNKKKWKMAK